MTPSCRDGRRVFFSYFTQRKAAARKLPPPDYRFRLIPARIKILNRSCYNIYGLKLLDV